MVVEIATSRKTAAEVEVLERAAAEHLRRHLPGDRDHRGAVQLGVVEAGEQVGRARAGDGEAGRRPAGELAVGAGGERRGALVADADEPQLAALLGPAQRVGEAEVGVADHPEDGVDAVRDQGLDQHVGDGARRRDGSGRRTRTPSSRSSTRSRHPVVEVLGERTRGRAGDGVVVVAVPRAAQQPLLDRPLAQRSALVRAVVLERARAGPRTGSARCERPSTTTLRTRPSSGTSCGATGARSRCCSPCNAPVAGRDQCASVPTDRRRVTATGIDELRTDVDLTRTRTALHGIAELLLAGPQYAGAAPSGSACCRPASPPWPRPTSGWRAPSWSVRAAAPARRAPTPSVAAAAGVSARTLEDVYSDRRRGRPPTTSSDRRRPPGRADRGPRGRRRCPARVRPRRGARALARAPRHRRSPLDEVNYGVSPGDASISEPYAYVGPWTPRTGEFWNQSFGAAQPMASLGGADAVADFFREGARLAAG